MFGKRAALMVAVLAAFLVLNTASAWAWPSDMDAWNSRTQWDINVSDGTTLTDYGVVINWTYRAGNNASYTDLLPRNNCSDDAYNLTFCIGSDCYTEDAQAWNNISGSHADVFIRSPEVNSTICIYWNNPDAPYQGDMNATWFLYDDFNTDPSGRFVEMTNYDTGTFTWSGSDLLAVDSTDSSWGHYTIRPINAPNVSRATSSDGWEIAAKGTYVANNDFAVHFMHDGTTCASGDPCSQSYDNYQARVRAGNTLSIYKIDDGAESHIVTGTQTTAGTHLFTVRFNDSAIWFNATLVSPWDVDILYTTDTTFTASAYMGLGAFDNGQGNFDWITMRKWHDPEPTATEGATESQVTIGITINVSDNSTNTSMDGWDVFMTNGTTNYTDTGLNTPSFFSYTEVPTGAVNITISDGSETLYYFNSTYEETINDTENGTLYAYLEPKPENSVSLSATPSWNLDENTEATVSCSVSEGTPSLQRNNITVSNPYTTTLYFGSYTFVCSVSETENYAPASSSNLLNILSGGFGCSNSSTYAFIKTISVTGDNATLNFTELVASNYVKSDLSDVSIQGNRAAWKNTTAGYYVVVNVTDVSTITVEFGNYIANNTYTETDRSGTTHNITAYTEHNSYYVLTFLEETTGAQQLPPNATIRLSLLCSQGASTVDINSSRLLVATFDSKLDEIKTSVIYSATEQYSRNRIVSSAVEYKNIYLVDADQNQVAQLLITLQDATGDFLNGILVVKKYMEGTLETMTEHYFDAERKAVTYLINGDKYQIYVESSDGTEVRNIGYLYVDPIDLSKTINIGELITLNESTYNISYSLYYTNTTDTIIFTMIDGAGLTEYTEFWVYNESDDLVYYANSTGYSINFNYNVPNASQEYKAEVKIHHPFYGENSITFSQIFNLAFLPTVFSPLTLLLPIAGSMALGLQAFLATTGMIFMGLLFGGRDSNAGAVLVFLVGAFAALMQWWAVDAVLLGSLLILAILNKLTEGKQEA